MKQLLVILLLLPLAATAQTVDPLISKDYLERIRDTSRQKVLMIDTANSVQNAFLLLGRNYTGYAIKKITVRNGYLRIQPVTSKILYLSGAFNSTVEVKKVNRLPGVQNQYVQGRSLNGELAWQGPETNELFSYGPALNTLEFDGSSYEYDVNGKLVPSGMGSGKNAVAYDNNIFRTAALLSQSLVLQGRYVEGRNQYLARVKLGQSRENTFIRYNRNTAQNISGFFEAQIRDFKLSATYGNVTSRFSNSNRNGFLNRVYQQSLLTPASFDNSQGSILAGDQRSYSDLADNPLFLLQDNGNAFRQSHHTGNITLGKTMDRLKLKLVQSGEKITENSQEGYKPGTAFFPGGILINRNRADINYYINANVVYDNPSFDLPLESDVAINYNYGNTRSEINYPATSYQYKRLSHDIAFTYRLNYKGYNTDAGARLENKFYISSTSLHNDFFLPGFSGYITFKDIFAVENLDVKVISNYTRFNSEKPVSTSFSQNNLSWLTAADALQYFPLTEVNSFNDLLPVRHREWTARVELDYKRRLTFRAEYFNRYIEDDVFPVYENGEYILKNLAAHRNRGVELELLHTLYRRNLIIRNSFSFLSYNDVVTGVKQGYDFTTIGGFSDINKTIAEGYTLGAIAGSVYQRDNTGNVIIGDEGFPLVSASPAVIGNPVPDFILKSANLVEWREFFFNLDWEWRKGGDVWNGTQAVLDYYGRSAESAQLRNVTGYVFQGVSTDGHTNAAPVSFYDPALPLGMNRWVRYGYAGVAEEYIRKGDCIRINTISLGYRRSMKKYLHTVSFTLYAGNILIWSGYKGVDPNQLLFDQPDIAGLDFFNLPSQKSFGATISIQF